MTKQFSSLIDVLAENAIRYRNQAALVLPANSPLSTESHSDFDQSGVAKSVTWHELAQWVFHLATQIQHRLGDAQPSLRATRVPEPIPRWNRSANPIVHEVRNTSEDLIFALGCQAAGHLEVPIDAEGGRHYVERCRDLVDGHWISSHQKEELVLDARLQCQSSDKSRCDRFPESQRAPASFSPNSPALLLWTSGTSGDPKGVVLSHRGLLANAVAKAGALPQTPSDRRLTLLSIAHAYARTSDIGTWLLSGCTIALAKGFQGWTSSSNWFDPTHCNMVPSLASRVLEMGVLPKSFSVLGCGGAAMSESEFQSWKDRKISVIQGYGLTEAGPVIASQSPQNTIAGHVGCIVDGWETRIDEQRLFVRGPSIMLGYWNAPSLTSERIDCENWLDTGDLVQISETCGQLKILGRADDRIILANGHNVDPHAIELRISTLPEIQTVYLRACADERFVELWIETASPPTGTAPLQPAAEFECDLIGKHWTAQQEQRLFDAVRQTIKDLPHWAFPRKIHPLIIAPGDRERLFNRKGVLRRSAMERHLQSLTQP